MIVGKMTGNETKVQEGKDKAHGNPGSGRAGDGDYTEHDHPGITYTKRGAMKQINIQRPPPPSSDTPEDQVNIKQRNADNDAAQQDHPGISYSQHGAMRQTCLNPPPPQSPSSSTNANENEHDNKWTADTAGTFNFGTNLDSHPHVNYAGPNLTATLPPVGSDEDLAIVQQKQGQEERYDLLHGGFPTGAPSPGVRGRGPEVVDKFYR
jgi:hypothetical protein